MDVENLKKTHSLQASFDLCISGTILFGLTLLSTRLPNSSTPFPTLGSETSHTRLDELSNLKGCIHLSKAYPICVARDRSILILSHSHVLCALPYALHGTGHSFPSPEYRQGSFSPLSLLPHLKWFEKLTEPSKSLASKTNSPASTSDNLQEPLPTQLMSKTEWVAPFRLESTSESVSAHQYPFCKCLPF